MPLARTTTDLQRNMGEVSKLCHETEQPVYITRNGSAELVIMDAAAFERAVDLRELAYEREMRTLEGIQRGLAQVDAGVGRPYADMRGELDL